MFESEIFSQLYEYLNESTLLSDRQCGFRPKYGTSAALIEMCDLWQSHIDKGKLNGVVFLDIRKAFDSGTFTCLGVKPDGKLNWDNHIDSICQKVSAGIGIMRRIKAYVPRKTLLDIYS